MCHFCCKLISNSSPGSNTGAGVIFTSSPIVELENVVVALLSEEAEYVGVGTNKLVMAAEAGSCAPAQHTSKRIVATANAFIFARLTEGRKENMRR